MEILGREYYLHGMMIVCVVMDSEIVPTMSWRAKTYTRSQRGNFCRTYGCQATKSP